MTASKTIYEGIILGHVLTIVESNGWYRFTVHAHGARVDEPLASVEYHEGQLPANSIGSAEWLEGLVEDLLGRARGEGLCTA